MLSRPITRSFEPKQQATSIPVVLAGHLFATEPAKCSIAGQRPGAACDVCDASSQLAEPPEQCRRLHSTTARAMGPEQPQPQLSSILEAFAVTTTALG
jgi:hypothetical protein